MGSGQWKVGSENWKVGSGKCEVESGKRGSILRTDVGNQSGKVKSGNEKQSHS